MAMTAWETYVEDRLLEAATQRLNGLDDASIASFVQAKLDEEIRRLHNPNSAKTVQLFHEYAGVDLKQYWKWNNHDEKSVRESLDKYVKLRGDVVHRSRPVTVGPPQAHPVKKEDLERVIRFLKKLVDQTENAFHASAS
jgi:hypothetical protein